VVTDEADGAVIADKDMRALVGRSRVRTPCGKQKEDPSQVQRGGDDGSIRAGMQQVIYWTSCCESNPRYRIQPGFRLQPAHGRSHWQDEGQ